MFSALTRAAQWRVDSGTRLSGLSAAAARDLWAGGHGPVHNAALAAELCVDVPMVTRIAYRDPRVAVRRALRSNPATPLATYLMLLDSIASYDTSLITPRLHAVDYDELVAALPQCTTAVRKKVEDRLASHPCLTIAAALALPAGLVERAIVAETCSLSTPERVIVADTLLSRPNRRVIFDTMLIAHASLAALTALVARTAKAPPDQPQTALLAVVARRPDLSLELALALVAWATRSIDFWAPATIVNLADNAGLDVDWRATLPAAVTPVASWLDRAHATPDAWVLAAQMLPDWVGSSAELVETVLAATA